MLTRHLGGLCTITFNLRLQRGAARIVPMMSLWGQWISNQLIRLLQHVINILACCHGASRSSVYGVGRANNRVALPRNNEKHDFFGFRENTAGSLDTITRHDNVSNIRKRYFKASVVFARIQFSGPDSGGVNNVLGFDREFLSAQDQPSRTCHLARVSVPIPWVRETQGSITAGGEDNIKTKRASSTRASMN